MDRSLNALCDALVKIVAQLKPQTQALSFILVTGKIKQGKSALLCQANLIQHPIATENNANLFYNQHGVIIELGETWLSQSENLLAYTLKQLNRCHRSVKISGIALCVNSSELLIAEPLQLVEECRAHALLLERFGRALDYSVDTAIIFTKLDCLAGFCEFFQAEHITELKKPLGFSLDFSQHQKKLINNYQQQFDQMTEVLGQQIIHKLHPARSSIKRTLIREFPLQLASLRAPIQSLIQHLPNKLFHLRAIYFTSAEQGGQSVDRLTRKIQHEYALSVQDTFSQSNNYRAYFIEGAIGAFQEQTKRYVKQLSSTHKWTVVSAGAVVALCLTYIGSQHIRTSHLLDDASKELLTYEALSSQNDDKTTALYHLSIALSKLKLIPANFLSLPIIEQLKSQLYTNTKHRLHNNFLPELMNEIEQVLADPAQTQVTRYQALKVYLMLAEPKHYSETEIISWFAQFWQNSTKYQAVEKQLLLLKNALKQPLLPLMINNQLVRDTRNYLNALPAPYLYYTLAKGKFSQHKQRITIEGFDLVTRDLPSYYTKTGYKQIIQTLPRIAAQLQQENWVLSRQDLQNLPAQLEQAYNFDYVTWWQNFTRKTRPQHYQSYQQARQLTQSLHQTNAIPKLIALIQQHVGPDLTTDSSHYNQKIASQFTYLNLLSNSTITDLAQTISELEKFLTTLSLVNDDGRTVFALTKSRFQGDNTTEPLSALYNKSRLLPEPVASWSKQIADDTWSIFISESRAYLNKQWQQTVFQEYESVIANRYPLSPNEQEEIKVADFDHFFAPQGTLNTFVNQYIKPFLDTSQPQWQPKELNGYVLPISSDIINELIRANIISNMFFPENSPKSKIEFSLQKINLDPMVGSLQLTIGKTKLVDDQSTESFSQFTWPQSDARLILYSIEGNHYELNETGVWAFFKMLQKVNVLVDNDDSANLQILFEVNGNSGRYLLKTQNQINPFSPGVFTGFVLKKDLA